MNFLKRSLSFFAFFYCLNAQALERGTDVGNGGDPVREVVNGARPHASGLAKKTIPAMLKEHDVNLSEALVSKYVEARDKLISHLENDVHDWGKYEALTDCAAPVISDPNVLKLSYTHCSKIATDAALATGCLLRATFRKITNLDANEIGQLVDALMGFWEKSEPKDFAKARSLKLHHVQLVGLWTCSRDMQNITATVYPEGLFKFSQSLQTQRIEFSDFLHWQAKHKIFNVTGTWTRPRSKASNDPNFVTNTECRYKITARMGEEHDDALTWPMTIQFGGASLDADCPAARSIAWDYICRRDPNAGH